MKGLLGYRIVGALLAILGIAFLVYAFLPIMPGVGKARSGRITLVDCVVTSIFGWIALYVGWRFIRKGGKIDQSRD